MRGLLRSPTASQSAAPKARAPFSHFAVRVVVLPVRQHAPVVELLAVDAAPGAELLAELDLVVARDDGDRDRRPRPWRSGSPGSRGRRRRPRRARRRRLQRVRRPAVEHAVGRGADEHVGRRRLPRQVLRLRQALVRLHPGELREAAPVGLVAPDPEARANIGSVPGRTVGSFAFPHAAVDDDLVADLDVGERRCRPRNTMPEASLPPMWKASGRLPSAVRLDDVDRGCRARPRRCCS